VERKRVISREYRRQLGSESHSDELDLGVVALVFPYGGLFSQGISGIDVSILTEADGDEYGATVKEEGIFEPVWVTLSPVLIGEPNLTVETTNMI
jgi:hypothetical protein